MKLLFLTGIFFVSSQGFAETKLTTAQYIDMWHETAVNQMHSHQIPASITLAQGILESGNGNSRLAREANNHFGIKCHKGWNGATFIQDDDTKDECFRSYYSAAESYTDHSLFLTGRSRYAGLFELKLHDYKGWAKGLKSAGYATNPKYAHLLISLIERYHLNQYDKMSKADLASVKKKQHEAIIKPIENKEKTKAGVVVKSKPKNEVAPEPTKSANYSGGVSVLEIKEVKHKVMLSSNKIKYIIVKEGDTFYRLAQQFEVTIAQLYRYNEFKNKDVLEVGDMIYIGPKKARGARGNSNYVSKKDITLREIAHEEGIKLSNLMKLNLSENPDAIITKGSKVTLR